MDNTADIEIRPVRPEDMAALTRLYNYYVSHTAITFETAEITIEEMARRMADITQDYPYLVCELHGQPVGYAYAHRWKPRTAYAHTAEVTIYLDHTAVGRGLGHRLLDRLIAECRHTDIHVLVACITQGNEASIALHRKMGFTTISTFHEVGIKFGQWLDVTDMQLIL